MSIELVGRRTAVFALGMVLIAAAGCGGEEQATLDEPSARTSLVTFLDEWKAGGTAEALQQKSPPIKVTDADWTAGATLVSYQLAADLINDGNTLETLVDLTLRSGGQEQVVRAKYTVNTQPAITINRSDTAPEAAG